MSNYTAVKIDEMHSLHGGAIAISFDRPPGKFTVVPDAAIRLLDELNVRLGYTQSPAEARAR